MERNEIIKNVDNILRNAEATYSGKLELIADYMESLNK